MSAKIMLVGGGTGGHITPNLAIARALKAQQPDCRLVYVLEKHARFSQFLEGQADIDVICRISAGKFRRYHGESWLVRLFDVKTIALNIRDAWRTLRGLAEARRLLRREKPDVIFIKGSFVGLPVGLAAAWLHIPFVTHDSDTMPGLANRLIGRWARYHATGMPTEFYAYPPAKTVFVGIPLSAGYHPVPAAERRQLCEELDLSPDSQVLLIVGASNGAEPVNRAIAAIAEALLADRPALTIVHQTGPRQAHLYARPRTNARLRVVEFLPAEEMVRYSAVADLIVCRAGATTIAEFAAQAKACIVIPNPRLTGGHQLKNAEALAGQGAIVLYPEDKLRQPEQLQQQVEALLNDSARRQELGRRLNALARPQAAADIARLVLEIAEAGDTRV